MEEYLRPKTIEELKQFCADKGMPLEQMRFYIGEDYREPRAFGIYQDENGEFVVCKDKSDGSRAIRRLRECQAEALLHLVALASDLLRKSAVGQGLYFVAQFHRQSSAEMQQRAVHRIADPREENCRLAYVKSPF